MSLLPPVPDGVCLLEATADVNGYEISFVHWLLVPDIDSGSEVWFDNTLTAYELEVGPHLLDCMHSASSFTTCRLSSGGPHPFTWEKLWPPNHGRWTSGQANNVAVGLYVKSTSGGRGSGSRCRLPACPDVFVGSNRQITQIALGNLLTLADSIFGWLASITGPTGAPVEIGTLQRRTAAGPRSAAAFDPASTIVPSRRVETLRRRLPRGGQVSPF